MNKSEQQNLMEIQSLYKQIDLVSGLVGAHKLRKRKMIDLREIKTEEHDKFNRVLNFSKEKLHSCENDLHVIDKELDKNHQHSENIKTEAQQKALEKEKEILDRRKQVLEKEILILMEKIEEIETKLKEIDNFFVESDKSIVEIETEIAADILKEEKKISSYMGRVAVLLNQCPSDFRSSFYQLIDKHGTTKFLAIIKDKTCQLCHVTIDPKTIGIASKDHSLEYCPGCGRLIVLDE